MSERIDFQVAPAGYRHWRVDYAGELANLYMDVDEQGGLFEGYELKLNSYDLGVDIELADIVQRLRFEHPEVKVVVLQSGKERVFCAGANIRMLAGATHAHKVNFCKFTNETRNALEAAGRDSGQHYICAIRGTCAGGGYELALACEHIILADDGSSSVALPEVPLLAVLPGTGGLTRLTDKRKVRRDLADVFCSTEEGVKGRRAADWRLVDEAVPNSQFAAIVAERAREFAASSKRAAATGGIELTPLERRFHEVAASLIRPSSSTSSARSGWRRSRSPVPKTRRRRTRTLSSRLVLRSGCCAARASSTTRSCICASTSPSSARSCSAAEAIRRRRPLTKRCSLATLTTGSPTRSSATGSACSSGST